MGHDDFRKTVGVSEPRGASPRTRRRLPLQALCALAASTDAASASLHETWQFGFSAQSSRLAVLRARKHACAALGMSSGVGQLVTYIICPAMYDTTNKPSQCSGPQASMEKHSACPRRTARGAVHDRKGQSRPLAHLPSKRFSARSSATVFTPGSVTASVSAGVATSLGANDFGLSEHATGNRSQPPGPEARPLLSGARSVDEDCSRGVEKTREAGAKRRSWARDRRRIQSAPPAVTPHLSTSLDGGTGDACHEMQALDWPDRTGVAGVCKAEPRLMEALRQFEEEHPGATIIYLAHSGSRLYGTNTPNSDLDMRGIFIPPPPMTPVKAVGRISQARLGDQAVSAALVTGNRSRAASVAVDLSKAWFPRQGTFWFTTSDNRAMNTEKDLDLELMSLDEFFMRILKRHVTALETLFSMLVPEVAVVSDPLIVPLIVRERKWMVSRNVSTWVGYVHSHLNRFRKVAGNFQREALEQESGPDKDEGVRRDSPCEADVGHGQEEDAVGKQSHTGAKIEELEGLESSIIVVEGSDVRRGRSDGRKEARRRKSGKLLAHARRAIIEAEELMNTGKITFPLKPMHVEELRRLKEWQVHIRRKTQGISNSISELVGKAKKSALPLEADRFRIRALRDEIILVHEKRDHLTVVAAAEEATG